MNISILYVSQANISIKKYFSLDMKAFFVEMIYIIEDCSMNWWFYYRLYFKKYLFVEIASHIIRTSSKLSIEQNIFYWNIKISRKRQLSR